MRQYNFFAKGGPFPGTCVGCRSNKDLFDLGADLLSGGNAMLCLQCVDNLAAFTGYAPKQPLLDEIAALKAEIVSRETELKKVPTLVEGLIDGIRSTVADFVLTISDSSVSSSTSSVREPETISAGHPEVKQTSERYNKAPKQPISK